jgi:hypothetical protein
MGHAKEMIMGDTNDEQNVYQWKEVQLNLPGYPYYDPSLPWVPKVREDGESPRTCSFIWMHFFRRGRTLRNVGGPPGRSPAFATTWAFRMRQGRGERREASKVPGLWAGSMIYTDDSAAGVRILVSRKKWAKAKRLLATLYELVLASEWVYHKVL